MLPLTSIERYHLADDSSRYPNTVACELLVRGPVDPDIATVALRETAKRHPLCHSRLELSAIPRRSGWRIDPAMIDQTAWRHAPGSRQSSLASTHIDLAAGGPGDFVWSEEGDLTRLSFRGHHAATDGGGGLQLVADWLTLYHRVQTGRNEPALSELDGRLLRQRNRLGLLEREFLSRAWIQPIAVLGATKFLLRKVQQLLPPANRNPVSAEAGEASSCPRLFSATIDRADVTRLRQEAKRRSATLNDLLVRAVFLAIHRLRVERGWHAADEWLRLVIPVSIRDFADRRMPAANRASVVQLDRRDRDFADEDGLLWGINYELGNIRRWNLAKTFLVILRGMSCVPGWIGRAASRPVCRATSVVTNLGSPFDRLRLPTDESGRFMAGNLLVEDIDLVVPLRPLTPAGFAVMRYAGRLRINLHIDPQVVPREVAETLLQRTVNCLLARDSA